jgi:hypothetical protein
MNFGDLVNMGSAGAVIVTVGLFLAHLRSSQKESRAEREVEREQLTDLIANDLKHVTEGLEGVVSTLREFRKGDQ